uniref:Peptidase S8/S53 domain-containing protein n=1 Tax=Trichuris muris TaxID=70415 RepID=A0A5S6Q8Z4_TRIMR
MVLVLKESLAVWSKPLPGVAILPSYCSGSYHVENVKPATLTVIAVTITGAEDTAGWAVSKNAGANSVFCVSDSGRTVNPKNVVGGAVWLQKMELQQLFMAVVNTAGLKPWPTGG